MVTVGPFFALRLWHLTWITKSEAHENASLDGDSKTELTSRVPETGHQGQEIFSKQIFQIPRDSR